MSFNKLFLILFFIAPIQCMDKQISYIGEEQLPINDQKYTVALIKINELIRNARHSAQGCKEAYSDLVGYCLNDREINPESVAVLSQFKIKNGNNLDGAAVDIIRHMNGIILTHPKKLTQCVQTKNPNAKRQKRN